MKGEYVGRLRVERGGVEGGGERSRGVEVGVVEGGGGEGWLGRVYYVGY